MTYLALGDSYTIGESVQFSESFPCQTVKLLRGQGIKIADPDIIAEKGWTTGDLIRAIEKTDTHKRYDIVSLLIGVNNQYQGRSFDEYASEFSSLVNSAIAFNNGRPAYVFVLSIPDYSVTPFAAQLDKQVIFEALENFNSINRKIAGENGVHYLEITHESRRAGKDLSLIASDGLHFSGKEYARWAALLASSVRSALL